MYINEAGMCMVGASPQKGFFIWHSYSLPEAYSYIAKLAIAIY